MKLLFYLSISFLIISCSSNKTVYWCGDHPCIDKNEKEAYFKKTMIVEVKNFSKKKLKENSDIEKIMEQAKTQEKRRIKKEKVLVKQAKLEKKRRLKEEKVLAKQAKQEKKRRLKEEKVLAKQIEKDEKKIIKKDKKVSKKITSVDTDLERTSIASTNFQKIVKEINKKNIFRPYPNINDIPN